LFKVYTAVSHTYYNIILCNDVRYIICEYVIILYPRLWYYVPTVSIKITFILFYPPRRAWRNDYYYYHYWHSAIRVLQFTHRWNIWSECLIDATRKRQSNCNQLHSRCCRRELRYTTSSNPISLLWRSFTYAHVSTVASFSALFWIQNLVVNTPFSNNSKFFFSLGTCSLSTELWANATSWAAVGRTTSEPNVRHHSIQAVEMYHFPYVPPLTSTCIDYRGVAWRCSSYYSIIF